MYEKIISLEHYQINSFEYSLEKKTADFSLTHETGKDSQLYSFKGVKRLVIEHMDYDLEEPFLIDEVYFEVMDDGGNSYLMKHNFFHTNRDGKHTSTGKCGYLLQIVGDLSITLLFEQLDVEFLG
ncbi:hypothetical protein K6Q96_11245 [Grimontia kaedaensis]|uniref:Uncharacterized protein n=1 Tax=Grimontia kaedaensis TaxID=2872157 RepID=A0ABY4WQB1_9GAMM|nr:hypothetical protein [Grimontia kaedaensis]USH01475.1 hypothetical protein K6Q96_11245 [Grimontia kaedaensis]